MSTIAFKEDDADRVLGFELGGYDYVVKPFSDRELMMRVKIHSQPRAGQSEVLRAGPLERTVDIYIVRLRNKIESTPGKPRWIHSIQGVGYTFQDQSSHFSE